MARLAYIYTLSDKRTGEIRYVGKTFDMKQRFYGHMHFRKSRPRTKNSCWIESLKRDGYWPVMEELESFPENQISEWEDAERFWIQTLRFYGCNLNNLDSGGGSGRTASPETRLKIGKSRIGFTHTPESKAKISASCKARMTEAEKENLRKKCTGFKHSEETKQYISSLKKGIPKPDHVRAALIAGSIAWKEEQGYNMNK